MLRKPFIRVLPFVAAMMSYCSVGYATSTFTAPADNQWEWHVAPYLWALNMNGRVGVADKAVHLNQNFNDILNKLSWAGMVWLDANKDKWGVYVNALYAVLSTDGSRGIVSASAKNNFGIFGLGGSYELYRYCFAHACSQTASSIAINPYVGLRYTVNDTTVKVSIPSLAVQRSTNENWTDPLVGARIVYTMTKAWQLMFAGDIGGTNGSDHYSYSATGLFGYSPQTMMTNSTVYLGYRILDQHYTTGSGRNFYDWNMKIFGPLLGVDFSF